jgi:hypothetical protein
MIKSFFLVTLLLLATACIHGQLYSTTTASVSADIIIPVGTEKSGEMMIAGSFYSGKEPGIVKLNSTGIVVNDKTGLQDLQEKAGIPSFHVVCDQYIYSITFSFDPLIVNRNAVQETMRVESVTILPVTEKKSGQLVSDSYSIGATVRVGPSQAPGQYVSGNPCIITVNFN